MAISDTQAAPAGQSVLCDDCRHSVEVRGMAEVVCLAYLTIRDPVLDVACAEFESKRPRNTPAPKSP